MIWNILVRVIWEICVLLWVWGMLMLFRLRWVKSFSFC